MKKPLIADIEIGGPFKIQAQQIWIKDQNRKPPELGEAITPTAVQASSSDTASPAANLINGKGLRDFNLDGVNAHSSDPSQMWRSVKGETKTWVEFDLGKPQKLNSLCIWNYNETWHTNRGVRKLDLSVWTPEAGWQKIRPGLPVDLAEGSNSYNEPTVVKLDLMTVQKVRFDNLLNLGDADYIGLSKVQFFGPAVPKTFKLSPADGAEGIGINNLELTWPAGDKAKAYAIYLGTSPENLKLLGKVEQAGVQVSQLQRDTKYYWRVDKVQADSSTTAGKVCTFTTGGLAAWWKLDEAEGTKAADSSAHGRDGVLRGDPTWQPQGGKIGGALRFDGMQDGVDTGWADDLATWTVSVWAKSPAAPISAKVPSGPVHRQNNYQVNWNHRNGELRGAAGVYIGSTWYAASFGSLDANVWYHLVATFDGHSLKAYKDGVLISENPRASGRPVHESATLKLGKNSVQEGGYFAGTIDEVSIFTYALSAEEVKALYGGKEPTTPAGDLSTPTLVSQR